MQVSIYVHYIQKNVVIRLGIQGLDSLLWPTRLNLFLRPSSWCVLRLTSNPYRFLTTKLLKVSCSICSGDALICNAPYQGWAALSQHYWVWAHHREHCSDSSIMSLTKLLWFHGKCPQRQCSIPSHFLLCARMAAEEALVHVLPWQYLLPALQFIWMHSSLNGLTIKTSLCNREEPLSQQHTLQHEKMELSAGFFYLRKKLSQLQ